MSHFTQAQIDAWQQGRCADAWKVLGAHPRQNGFRFEVWAPHARAVHLVGDFNGWDTAAHPMHNVPATGTWTAVAPEARTGQNYKYHITPDVGEPFLKADPYGFLHQVTSHRASVLSPLPDYGWKDQAWMDERSRRHRHDQPLSVYEVHLGSWRQTESGGWLCYREMADQLVPYVKEMGFTHIELMPVMEHPYGASWGYQVTGYFAPTARYGEPEGLMALVDACHREGIGVILDWVPGHFPNDDHGLAYFDGTPLYEYADAARREHPDWGTYNFDHEKEGVRNFLLSNASFWCEKYHIDGLRVDAVASMLYLDYSRAEGEWQPNQFGGNENLASVAFLQDLNRMLDELHPSVLTFAEESTAWPGVTRPVAEGGLGFDYKWNMGWMNDTLRYFSAPPRARADDAHSITFPITYAFSEQFILPLSHDEVVHLKQSLWSKMPGTPHQKFAQLRLLLLFMIGSPGKKLLFMGSELAQKREWAEERGLDWHLLEDQDHHQLQQFVARMMHLYQSTPALYRCDGTADGFEWKDLSLKEKGVFTFSRSCEEAGNQWTFVFNFSPEVIDSYLSGLLSLNRMVDTLEPQPTLRQGEELVHLQPFQGLLLHQP